MYGDAPCMSMYCNNGNMVSAVAEDVRRSYLSEADNKQQCSDKLLQQLCYLGTGKITCTANDELSALRTLLAIGKNKIGKVCYNMIERRMSEVTAKKVQASTQYIQLVQSPKRDEWEAVPDIRRRVGGRVAPDCNFQ